MKPTPTPPAPTPPAFKHPTLSVSLLGALTLLGLMSLDLSGCVRQIEPASLDAFISGGDPMDMGPPTYEPLADEESSRVLAQTRAGSYALVLNGFLLNQVCEAATGQLTADGQRALCVPDSISSPLRFHDLVTGPIFNLEGWEIVDTAYPTLDPTGDFFMAPVLDENNNPVLGVFDVFQTERGRVTAIVSHGFAGPKHLVINDPPSLWSFDEPEREPYFIGSNKVKVVQVEPYGVVYEQAGGVYFLGVNGGAAERISDDKLVDVLEDRALFRALNDDGGYDFILYDLRAREEVGRVASPVGSFTSTLNVRLVSRFGALAEQQLRASCGGERSFYSTSTHVLDFRRSERRLIYEAEVPHLAEANELSPYAWVTEVDPCVRPTGTYYLWNVREQSARALPSRTQDALHGRVSRKGEWLALWGETGSWLIKTSDLSVVPIRQGDPVYSLEFR